jgi:predicted methyltransferase
VQSHQCRLQSAARGRSPGRHGFRNARRYLRPGGRVAIIDLAGKGWFDSMFGHWTPAATIREEMEAAGYRLDAEPPLPRQSFLIFR